MQHALKHGPPAGAPGTVGACMGRLTTAIASLPLWPHVGPYPVEVPGTTALAEAACLADKESFASKLLHSRRSKPRSCMVANCKETVTVNAVTVCFWRQFYKEPARVLLAI